MQRVVSFYEKLPRGAAPAEQPRGLLQRYQTRYMNGKNASAMRTYKEELQYRNLAHSGHSTRSRHWRSYLDRLRPELLLPLAYVVDSH